MQDALQREHLDRAFGQKGFKVIADTSPVTGHFFGLLAVGGAAVLDSAGTVTAAGDQIVDNHSVPEGVMLHGPFTSVQLASGIVYAYYA